MNFFRQKQTQIVFTLAICTVFQWMTTSAHAESAANNSTESKGKHLFILSGQSNMGKLDADQLFTPIVAEQFGKDNVIVVKDAQGGKAIRFWYKDWKQPKGDTPKGTGEFYDLLMKKVKVAIENQKIQSVTFIWMQGESDGLEKFGEVYAASLKGLIEQLKKDLGQAALNVVIGRISDYKDKDVNTHPHWEMVRKAQVEVAESNPDYTWIDTDDLNGPENALHYDSPPQSQFYKTLGKRFANKAIELITGKPVMSGKK